MMADVDLEVDLPPALGCADEVFALLPEVPLAAGAAVVVEVMAKIVVDLAS